MTIRANELEAALADVGKKWTRQIKAEERSPRTRRYRSSMYASRRISFKEICFDNMEAAWMKASGDGRLPTYWRQVFYVMRPLVEEHHESPGELRDETFKNILDEYIEKRRPGWDILRGARGVFKEPHRALADNGLAMSTMNVRDYLGADSPSARVESLPIRFPTQGAVNRIAAVLICEKEGFDELLEAAGVPERFDLALMSTKGISAIAARDLASGLGVPCYTLHDLDKNGFVMIGGFPFATDLGIRLEDVEEWGLAPESQTHSNPDKTRENLLRNGATPAEADFISNGERVELNMFTGPDFIEFVEGKLCEHGVEKVVPDDETLEAAWKRVHVADRVNKLIEARWETADVPPMPDDLADRIRESDSTLSWDEALYYVMTKEDAP